MKRMLMAMAALGLIAGAVRADWGGPGGPPPTTGPAQVPQIGGPNTLLGLGDPYNGTAPDKYGLNPRIKRFFRLNTPRQPATVPPSYYYPQMGYGQNGPAYNPTGYPPGAYGAAQGTLVFPHHALIRSPRDYFMYDPNANR
jgi:hypothetical protein